MDRHLTTANVNAANFGFGAFFPTDGQVIPQVLFVPRLFIGGTQHDVAYGATENSSIYAWDIGASAYRKRSSCLLPHCAWWSRLGRWGARVQQQGASSLLPLYVHARHQLL